MMTLEQLETVAKELASEWGVTVEVARERMRMVAKHYLVSTGEERAKLAKIVHSVKMEVGR